MQLKEVQYKEPLMEGKVPKSYVELPDGKIYEIIPEGDPDPYDGETPETDTYYLRGKEEYYNWETVCKTCGVSFIAYNNNYELVRNYCPGCGKRLQNAM